jgi:hypothetical protein
VHHRNKYFRPGNAVKKRLKKIKKFAKKVLANKKDV